MAAFDFTQAALNSFLNALIIPIKNEYVYGVLLAFHKYPKWQLFSIAFTFSSLGSIVTFILARKLAKIRNKEWFSTSNKEVFDKAEIFYKKYLFLAPLLSFADIIGNPLVIAAGFLKMDFKKFLPLMLIGKALFYLLMAL